MRKTDGVTPCLGQVPDYEIRFNDILYISAGDWECCIPLRLYMLGRAKADKVIAEHFARKAEVMPFKRKRSHAAS